MVSIPPAMIKHSIGALIVVLALLTACAPSEPMPTPQIAVATVTEEPASTSIFVPTKTLTLSPTDTPAPTATPMPTDTLVPARTPTLGPPITRTPAPAAECPPSGNPPPLTFSTLIDDDVIVDELKDYLDAGASVANLQAALTEMKVGNDTIQARVINQDVTGDGHLDIILDMVVRLYGSGDYNAAFIFWCDHGHYVSFTIGNLIAQLPEFGDHDRLQVVEDMNQDGVPEMVSSRIVNWGIHGNTERLVRIYEWNGAGFDNLILSYLDYYGNQDFTAAYIGNGDAGIVRDTNSDGYRELLLTGGIYYTNNSYDPAFFFRRERTEVWAWNGSAFTLAHWEYAPPKYRIQAVWDGDDASSFGNYAKALAFYQQAIFDEQLLARPLWLGSDSPDPDDRSRLSAYARYRIMLLHVIQGHLPEAQVVYDTLQKKFQAGSVGSEYAALATTFWEAYSAHQNIGLACAKAIEQAETYADEVLDPLGYDYYSGEWPDFQPLGYAPEEICPFR